MPQPRRFALTPLIAAIAMSALATLPAGAGATQSPTSGGEGGTGRRCQLPNGTVINDGRWVVTSHGTTIYCHDGHTCRTGPSGKFRGCIFEPETVAARPR